MVGLTHLYKEKNMYKMIKNMEQLKRYLGYETFYHEVWNHDIDLNEESAFEELILSLEYDYYIKSVTTLHQFALDELGAINEKGKLVYISREGIRYPLTYSTVIKFFNQKSVTLTSECKEWKLKRSWL